jgi:TM2 domain-containing membrane protein YozV
MIGHIESYDENTQTGSIKSEDKFFAFYIDDWQADVPPEAGDDVLFEVDDNKAISVNLMGAYLGTAQMAVKSRLIARCLSVLFGTGAHRLYLGYYKMAVAQLAFTLITHGYGVVWGVVDAVLLLAGHINKDAKGRPLK